MRVIAGLVLLAGCQSAANVAPMPATLGAVDPRVTQADIHQTICVKGYTATVRPPTSYTAPIKAKLLAALPASVDHKPGDYELDHQVPLEVGGAPRDPKNLVLQLWAGPAGAHAKDAIENKVHAEVCAGTMTLAAGQRCFELDWRRC